MLALAARSTTPDGRPVGVAPETKHPTYFRSIGLPLEEPLVEALGRHGWSRSDDPVVIHRELLRLADRTAARVRAAGMMGRTVSIKVRFADFTTITRARTLRDPTDVSRDIYATARSLFDALGLQRARIRLVGVRMEGLVEAEGAPVQGMLDEPDHGWRDADRAVDQASARFGAGAVRPAALVHDRGEAPRSAAAAAGAARAEVTRGGRSRRYDPKAPQHDPEPDFQGPA